MILKGLIELDGIGETQVDAVEIFFSKQINVKITKNLIDQLNVNDFLIKNKDGKFSNKKLMFTGGFRDMSRSEFRVGSAYLPSLGGPTSGGSLRLLGG